MCSAPFYRDLAAPGNGFMLVMLVEAFLVKEAEALNMLLNPVIWDMYWAAWLAPNTSLTACHLPSFLIRVSVYVLGL